MIVLKNLNGKETVRTVFRGRKVTVRPKHAHILRSDEEGKAEAKYLLDKFRFITDITNLIAREVK